jgi:hypothetical protein
MLGNLYGFALFWGGMLLAISSTMNSNQVTKIFVASRGAQWHGRKGYVSVRRLRMSVWRQDATLRRTSVGNVGPWERVSLRGPIATIHLFLSHAEHGTSTSSHLSVRSILVLLAPGSAVCRVSGSKASTTRWRRTERNEKPP